MTLVHDRRQNGGAQWFAIMGALLTRCLRGSPARLHGQDAPGLEPDAERFCSR